ncbi:hypothetical protein phiPLPE_66 [Iodobacter phage PhiPLPE]|uniref:Uncharacterized protein n=1 Tax=Iodobacter phage PhiPLPE TaxID=551895 RepID=B5AX85_9CAUD|nr:hypothetical protein phiPLPE_66 [Iodobacter phage PhiPLPE]ACG60388.1 hypothetical protein phiPLPE_66 [Iodobacter phage PhiPLPE]
MSIFDTINISTKKENIMRPVRAGGQGKTRPAQASVPAKKHQPLMLVVKVSSGQNNDSANRWAIVANFNEATKRPAIICSDNIFIGKYVL